MKLLPTRVRAGSLALGAVLAGCASARPAPPPPAAPFDGHWRVEWCDRTRPERDCGGFSAYLVQRGDRICGNYDGARVGLSQIDEGMGRTIAGAVTGEIAIIAIRSSRGGGTSVVRLERTGDALTWRTVEDLAPDLDDISILALDDTLTLWPGQDSRLDEARDFCERWWMDGG